MLSWMLNVEEAIGSHHEGKRPRDIAEKRSISKRMPDKSN